MSDDKNPSTITRQDILDAAKNPYLFKVGSDKAVIYDKKRNRNNRIITVSDEALKELKAMGFTRVEENDGEAHSITFSNDSRRGGVTIGVPSRAQFKWGDNGPIKRIENLKELETPASAKKADLGLSGSIQLAETEPAEVTRPNVPNNGIIRQI